MGIQRFPRVAEQTNFRVLSVEVAVLIVSIDIEKWQKCLNAVFVVLFKKLDGHGIDPELLRLSAARL